MLLSCGDEEDRQLAGALAEVAGEVAIARQMPVMPLHLVQTARWDAGNMARGCSVVEPIRRDNRLQLQIDRHAAAALIRANLRAAGIEAEALLIAAGNDFC